MKQLSEAEGKQKQQQQNKIKEKNVDFIKIYAI